MTTVVKRKIFSPLSIRNRALDYAGRPEPTEISQGRYGATVGNLTQAVKTAMNLDVDADGKKQKLTGIQNEQISENARLILAWLFQPEEDPFFPMSRTELQPDKPQGPQRINALGRWMNEYQGEYPNGEWVQRRMFMDELQWMLYWAGEAYKWTLAEVSIGGEMLFSECLKRYQDESIAGNDQDDHWQITTNYIMAGEFSSAEQKPEQPIPTMDAPAKVAKNDAQRAMDYFAEM